MRPSLLSDASLMGALRELLAQTRLRVQFQIQFDHESIHDQIEFETAHVIVFGLAILLMHPLN
ncbi:hypothetical protein [Bacillus sp. MB366]|uniref:hypothetical protein n=1 Tax=Bacillus sp. MB366 TaxID=1663555 RepID=UPI002015EE5B|nr:hypothetical protein [Bacillus sp. MB366]